MDTVFFYMDTIFFPQAVSTEWLIHLVLEPPKFLKERNLPQAVHYCFLKLSCMFLRASITAATEYLRGRDVPLSPFTDEQLQHGEANLFVRDYMGTL